MRIIGIRIYETKWHTINKVLKPDWYPFGNFTEPVDNVVYHLPQRSETVESLYDLYDNNPHIEVSCLVGMNGSGKSTLLDILYRIINNFSVTVLGSKMDNQHGRHLRFADGLNADLYYELEGALYKISCRDKEVKYFKQNDNGLFGEKKIKGGDLSDFDHFFYTISNNYSLYSLNEREYREEKKKEENGAKKLSEWISGNWVDGLFHKNDGYLSPIVITPYRERGSVDIENENGLALQRITAISVLSAAQKQPSILEGYKATSIKYSIYRSYKNRIFEKQFANWKEKIKQSFFERIIEVFVEVWKNKLGDKLKLLDELDEIDTSRNPFVTSTKELVLAYLAHKSFKICMTYDDYYTLFDTKGLLENCKKSNYTISYYETKWIDKRRNKFVNVVERLCNSQYDSHINLKIRQCLNFVVSPHYKKDEGEVEISTLIDGKKVETFDDAVQLLPPAFFHVDLIMEKDNITEEEKDRKTITISRMSSGERQILYSMSYVLYHIKNIQGVKPSNNCHLYHHINLIFDEAELYYHPDYQKQFVKKLIDYIARCNLDKNIIKSINVIIATHSPFVLTDILTQNTLYLNNGKRITVEKQTFGANYYDMLHDSFFFEDTALGGVATKRIKEWLTGKDEKGERVKGIDLEEMVDLVGDPLIVNYIRSEIHVQD